MLLVSIVNAWTISVYWKFVLQSSSDGVGIQEVQEE